MIRLIANNKYFRAASKYFIDNKYKSNIYLT